MVLGGFYLDSASFCGPNLKDVSSRATSTTTATTATKASSTTTALSATPTSSAPTASRMDYAASTSSTGSGVSSLSSSSSSSFKIGSNQSKRRNFRRKNAAILSTSISISDDVIGRKSRSKSNSDQSDIRNKRSSPIGQSAFVSSSRSPRQSLIGRSAQQSLIGRSARFSLIGLIGLCFLLVLIPLECSSESTPTEAEVKKTPTKNADNRASGAHSTGAMDSSSSSSSSNNGENLNSKESNPKKVIGGFVDEGGNSGSHIVKFDCSRAHHRRQEVHPPHCHNGGAMVEIHGGFHEAMPFQTCHCLCPQQWTGPMCSLPAY